LQFAAAWRADRWALLANQSGRFGLYAPGGDELQGELLLNYQADQRLEFRSNLAYKFASSIFTAQVGVGATYYLTDQFGLGANAGVLLQPATSTTKFSIGLEASYRLFDGFALSAGVNFLGFNALGSFSAAPGFYIRFDWKFDERTFGFGK
jgi:hypothetical protein